MMETIKAQQELLAAYRLGFGSPSERVFTTLDRAREAGLIE
jgi:hypothetical protein